jgi:hypothetical protein
MVHLGDIHTLPWDSLLLGIPPEQGACATPSLNACDHACGVAAMLFKTVFELHLAILGASWDAFMFSR